MQDFLLFVEKFEVHDNGEGYDISSREQQENNAQTNQQEHRHHRM